MNTSLQAFVTLYFLSPWALSPSLPSGLCLEKVPAASPSLSNKNTGSPSSNRSTTDREQEIITCYEKSGDIALLYLQEAEKVCLRGVLVFISCFLSNLMVWNRLARFITTYCNVFSHGVTQALTKYLVSTWTPECSAIPVGVWWIICWQCASSTNALQPMKANWQTNPFLFYLENVWGDAQAETGNKGDNKSVPTIMLYFHSFEHNRGSYYSFNIRCNEKQGYHLDKVTILSCCVERQLFFKFDLMINGLSKYLLINQSVYCFGSSKVTSEAIIEY